MTGPLVLPDDLEIIPVKALSATVRAQIGGDEQDYAVTRPLSRFPSKVISSQAAAWLRQFEEPTTLVEAILRHSKMVDRKPRDVLEEIYPFLTSCLHAKLLVEPGVQSEIIRPSFGSGCEVAGCRIEECIQVLADTELYRVVYQERKAALKITRPEASPEIKQNLAREASIQKRLDGCIAPRLFGLGESADGRAYVISEWISGQLCMEQAAVLRMSSRDPMPPALLSLCGNILDAYTILHRLGVTHGDVHPGNVMVEPDGEVRIVDYGLSRVACKDNAFASVPRGGVGFFLDPEYASAPLRLSVLPDATPAGEQYSIAALIYELISGRHYVDFSLERDLLLNQIAEQPPVPLSARGLPGMAALDRVLLRALSKDPSNRFPDMAGMAAAYWRDVVGVDTTKKGAEESSRHSGDSALSAAIRAREDWLKSFLDSLCSPEAALDRLGGPGSAYRVFRIACVREDPDLLALAERCLDLAESSLPPARAKARRPGGHGLEWAESDFGFAWVRALMAHCCWDFHRRSRATAYFLRACNAMLEGDIRNVDASALLASSLLLDAFRTDPTSDHEALFDLGNKLLDRLWEELDQLPPMTPLPDGDSRGSTQHWIQGLYATLQWMRAAKATAPTNLKRRLQQLADLDRGLHRTSHAKPGGYAGSAHRVALVFLWSLAFRLLENRRWLRLAEAAGSNCASCYPEDSSIRGLVGNAYGQLCLYKHTGEQNWLRNAHELANAALRLANDAACTREPRAQFHFEEGELGLATLINELASPRCSAMPFVEEECWPAATTQIEPTD